MANTNKYHTAKILGLLASHFGELHRGKRSCFSSRFQLTFLLLRLDWKLPTYRVSFLILECQLEVDLGLQPDIEREAELLTGRDQVEREKHCTDILKQSQKIFIEMTNRCLELEEKMVLPTAVVKKSQNRACHQNHKTHKP